ncbi:MAG: hypothetical protein ABI659_01450 [Nitrosospira sp.]
MKKSELIDMFGLSGDSSSNDQLDDLLFCLESDIPNVLETNSKVTCLSSFTTMPIADSAADDMFAASARWGRDFRLLNPGKTGALLRESVLTSMRPAASCFSNPDQVSARCRRM